MLGSKVKALRRRESLTQVQLASGSGSRQATST